MKINWRLRMQNKITLTAIAAAVIRIVYTILSWCGIIPAVAEDEVIYVLDLAIGVLVLLGVVTDPTTAGASDSEQAMEYTEPRE